jgi:hypothetical protein
MSIKISPWLLPTPFVALALLVGCSAKLDIVSKPAQPAASAPTTKVSTQWDNSQPVFIDEVCHDGILYLINNKGGMTHKVDPQRSSFGGAIHCPTKELK